MVMGFQGSVKKKTTGVRVSGEDEAGVERIEGKREEERVMVLRLLRWMYGGREVLFRIKKKDTGGFGVLVEEKRSWV